MTSFNTIFSSINSSPSRQDKLYLVTNEGKAAETLEKAKKYPVEDATVVLFTSAMFGLNYVAARGLNSGIDRRVEHLICVDNSPTVKLFWECLTPIIIRANNRKECIRNIIAMVNKHGDQFYPMDVRAQGCCSEREWTDGCLETWLEGLDDEINTRASWLSTDQGFQIIKRIFQDNKFVHICGSLFSSDLTKKIVNKLEELNLKLDSLYLSNINEIAELNNALDAYRSAIKVFKTVSTPNTFFIDTRTRCDGLRSKEPLEQRIRKKFNQSSIEKDIEASPESNAKNTAAIPLKQTS